MFENKLTENEKVHYSRYIASWVKVAFGRGIFGGPYDGEFVEWLKTEGLTKAEINEIWNMATNGRLEQETRAKIFLKSLEES